MIDANQIQKQKDEMFRLEAQVIPFLNQFEVLDCSASGEKLECVLIPETAENVQKLNEFLCFMNHWAIVPEHYAPAICEFLEYCHAEGAGTLDLAYMVYNYLNINTDWLWFGTAERKWVVR